MNFNLLDAKWIPVLYGDGTFRRVGILAALEDAGLIRTIAASNPMDHVAVLRFLVAVVYWCKGAPADGAERVTGRGIPSGWLDRLRDNPKLFELFGGPPRFFQDATARRERTVTDLLHEIPTGHNFWHLRHAIDGEAGLCPACCALGLLRLPLFSVSGIQGFLRGINGKPPIYVHPIKETLLATVLANWKPCDNIGIPCWELPQTSSDADSPVALLTGLTMLSRRVKLHDPKGTGRCFACAEQGRGLVMSCEFQPAGRQESIVWNDPHVVYTTTDPRATVQAPDLVKSGKFRNDRPWFDLVSQLMSDGRFGTFFAVGFATDEQKYIDVWERRIVIPAAAAEDGALVDRIARWKKEGGRLEARIGRRGDPGQAEVSCVASVRPHVEAIAGCDLPALLSGGDGPWFEAAEHYRPLLRSIAKSLAPGCTTARTLARRRISRSVPDIAPVAADKKREPRKGGKKG